LIGLSLASQLFSAPIPVSAIEVFESDKSVQQLSAEIAGRLILPTEASSKNVHVDRLRAHSRERLRERLPYYLRKFQYTLMPNRFDIEFLPLPNVLYPLYFVIRPIRLIYKYSPTIFRSGVKNTERKTDTNST
jgi:hypothetical protein